MRPWLLLTSSLSKVTSSRGDGCELAPLPLSSSDPLSLPGTRIRVIDPFTIKPLDAATIIASARATGGRIITVEDHYREGRRLLAGGSQTPLGDWGAMAGWLLAPSMGRSQPWIAGESRVGGLFPILALGNPSKSRVLRNLRWDGCREGLGWGRGDRQLALCSLN